MFLFQGSVTKKYKFVITGHGKYEKVATEDGAANGKSGKVTKYNPNWKSKIESSYTQSIYVPQDAT